MKMRGENHPCVQLKRLVFTAESQRFHQNIAATRGTEDGNPLHNAGGNEVREAGFIDSVATAHDGKVNETEFRQQVRSQSGDWERGQPRVPAC